MVVHARRHRRFASTARGAGIAVWRTAQWRSSGDDTCDDSRGTEPVGGVDQFSHEERMAITGHRTDKEDLRYTGDSTKSERAGAAMGKVMANHSKMLANAVSQHLEKKAL